MMSNTHHDLDLATLSALFDGELKGDAARFALKRLGHDAYWRQAFGNWQLVGDALRGQATTAAPAGFAARVAMAVVAEPVPVAAASVAAVSSVSAAPRAAASVSVRKWIGGAALAASVAMVAMFVARPFSQDAATTPGAATPAATELATAPTSTPAEVPAAVTPSPSDIALQVGMAAVAVAEVPRRAAERRSRGQSQRAALRGPKRPTTIASTTTAVAVHEQAPYSTVNPFRPQPAEAVSRPWPRAVLPAAPASAAFTVGYGSGAVSSPSFYPFEPRLPHATEVAPAPTNADGPRP